MNRFLPKLVLLLPLAGCLQADWIGFRGPGATGVTNLKNLPTTWSDKENIAWRTEIPGMGFSSPIVVGRKIFITTGIRGEKIEGVMPRKHVFPGQKTADFVHPQTTDADRKYDLKLLCIDADTGKVIWERTSFSGQVYDGKHTANSYASPTVVSDGRNAYAWFESQGMYAYDFDGKLLWKASLGGINELNLGPGSSPLLVDDMIIVQCDQDAGTDSFIAGISKKDGKIAWKTPRTNGSSWATPTLITLDGQKQVIALASENVTAYDPKTGKVLWTAPGIEGVAANTPIFGNGLLYTSSGYPKKKIQVIDPHAPADKKVVWSYDKGTAYVPSALLYGDYYYTIGDNGAVTCFDAKTGDIKYEAKRMPKPGRYMSSPFAFDGKILISSLDGDTFVIKAGPEFELLNTNSVGEPIHASFGLRW
ncbi:MAG: PQQ-binding-like beta-propeller repeat protein, partial [Bryobacteraceae bacterium]